MGAYSKLHDETYRRITQAFPALTLRENIRPDWLVSSKLTRLEIDIFIEELNTAVEIQGAQHYIYTPHFHKTYQEFKDQQNRDQEKRDLCDGAGIRLVEIACYMDLDGFIGELKKDKIAEKIEELKYFYSSPGKKERRPHKKARRSIVGSKRYWQWMKAKKKAMRESGKTWQEISEERAARANREKLPGSQRQRRYARYVLKCQKMNENTFFLWGGNEWHFVRKSDGVLRCDCRHYKGTGKICSHIIKIGFEHKETP